MFLGLRCRTCTCLSNAKLQRQAIHGFVQPVSFSLGIEQLGFGWEAVEKCVRNMLGEGV